MLQASGGRSPVFDQSAVARYTCVYGSMLVCARACCTLWSTARRLACLRCEPRCALSLLVRSNKLQSYSLFCAPRPVACSTGHTTAHGAFSRGCPSSSCMRCEPHGCCPAPAAAAEAKLRGAAVTAEPEPVGASSCDVHAPDGRGCSRVKECVRADSAGHRSHAVVRHVCWAPVSASLRWALGAAVSGRQLLLRLLPHLARRATRARFTRRVFAEHMCRLALVRDAGWPEGGWIGVGRLLSGSQRRAPGIPCRHRHEWCWSAAGGWRLLLLLLVLSEPLASCVARHRVRTNTQHARSVLAVGPPMSALRAGSRRVAHVGAERTGPRPTLQASHTAWPEAPAWRRARGRARGAARGRARGQAVCRGACRREASGRGLASRATRAGCDSHRTRRRLL